MDEDPEPVTDGGDAGDALDQIRTIRELYASVEGEGRFDPMLDYVADDFVFLPPGWEPMHGRETYAAMFNENMADAPSKNYQLAWESEETIVSGDVAVDRGVGHDSFTEEDGTHSENEYKYIMVYQRDGESWLLSRFMYNTID